MELAGKKIAILVETFYNEFEFWYPYYRLKEAGAQVTVVGSGSAEIYHSKAGLPAKVDTSAMNAALFFCTHEFYHAGQITTLRRLLGRERSFG